MEFRQNSTEATEIVIGIIGPIGCNREDVIQTIKKIAKHYTYETVIIGLSDIIRKHCSVPDHGKDEHKRVNDLMSAGTALRGQTKDNSILAKLAATEINEARKSQKDNKVIYIINTIKHPEEVEELRNIYGLGFYVFAIHSSQISRESYLKKHCLIKDDRKIDQLIQRDSNEETGHGQNTSEAFHLADFFLVENGDNKKLWNVIERFLDLIFGDPFKTPTFHEYSMYMAYAASTRSADMSRQVGAVITKDNDIISIGANECPNSGGGTYWPNFDSKTFMITDVKGGRDYTNNIDRNGQEKSEIIKILGRNIPENILEILTNNIRESGIKDITEYGRVVHAEMDAILGCARRGVSSKDTEMFCSTFPCHNCAKHIIASGIKHVVYIEPYPKSKALDMHSDAICVPDNHNKEGKVLFSPFVGVGPRIMINLFSLCLSTGEKVRRKSPNSYQKAEWNRSTARPRLKAFTTSYMENENRVKEEAHDLIATIEKIEIKNQEYI